MNRLTAVLVFALVLALVLVPTACTNQSPPTPPPRPAGEAVRAPIATGRSAYVMRNGELAIAATFTAPADRPVYLTNCNGAQPMGLQRLVGNDWVSSWVAALNACFSAPVEVPPGGRHSATLTIRPGAGAVTYPRGQESIESGTYRVAWFGVLRSYDPKKRPEDELPLEQRVSAPFTIDVQPPALASTPPPPPPGPRVASANVSGQVVDAHGFRVAHAEVLVRSADAGCRPLGPFVGAVSSENGDYFAVAQLESEQPLRGCVVVEAQSGGTSGKATLGVELTTASPRVHLDVRLEPAPPLTSVEAERLVRMLAAAIDEPAQTPRELGQYILHGPEALRVALEQYRTLLGKVTAVRPVDSFNYELRGANGATSRVNVHQEDLVRLHSPLLDYGFRSERFMTTYLRAIASGDAELLSRVLNPDDVDFPVERAREKIANYRRRYADTASIRAEFTGVAERRSALLWRLRGTGPNGEKVLEPIELVFGDGLIGMRGL